MEITWIASIAWWARKDKDCKAGRVWLIKKKTTLVWFRDLGIQGFVFNCLWRGDENQQVLKDPLYVSIGSITRARSKKFKEAFNGLIQEIWADSNTRHFKLVLKEDEGVINLFLSIEGWSSIIWRDLWCELMVD